MVHPHLVKQQGVLATLAQAPKGYAASVDHLEGKMSLTPLLAARFLES